MNTIPTTVLSSTGNKNGFSHVRAAILAAVLASSPLFAIAAPADKAVAAATAVQAEHAKVNINNATVETLSSLHGIGEAKAKSIVAYRTKFGNFRAVEDLLAVEGIGEATLTKNRGRIAL